MINFEEELKKFHPSLEVEDAEEAIYNQDLTDAADLLVKMMKEAEEKEEKIKIVEPGRENDKLTKMDEGVYKTIDEYHEKNELHCLVLMADKTGGASFIIGDEKMIAKEFKELTGYHEAFKKVLNLIKK